VSATQKRHTPEEVEGSAKLRAKRVNRSTSTSPRPARIASESDAGSGQPIRGLARPRRFLISASILGRPIFPQTDCIANGLKPCWCLCSTPGDCANCRRSESRIAHENYGIEEAETVTWRLTRSGRAIWEMSGHSRPAAKVHTGCANVKIPQRYPSRRSAIRREALAGLSSLMLLVALAQGQDVARDETLLGAKAVYQGAEASDAFSAIHYLGNGRIIAGKRSSHAANRFLLSEDYGATWEVVGCPNSTGAHTYFFGQNGATVLSGTGDTGSACLMKSTDTGSTWTVALSSAQIRSLIESTNARAVFSPVYLGANRWMVNIKSFDTISKVIMSANSGETWYVPSAQPGQGASAWARQMILTSDSVVLWPSCTTDKMYMSTDQGTSWSSVTVPGAFLFQPLCDAGNGIYLCGDARTTPYTPISLYRSLDEGLSWAEVTAVNLQRPTTTYWRDVIKVENSLLASACCVEGTSTERHMQLFLSEDDGTTWLSLGNPLIGPYGGMQAIYQMCATELNVVFAACQPDSTILRWPMPVGVDSGVPGDLDGNGDVDLADFALFASALAGPVVWEPPPGCDLIHFIRADLDGDLDVDLADFAIFQLGFAGPQ